MCVCVFVSVSVCVVYGLVCVCYMWMGVLCVDGYVGGVCTCGFVCVICGWVCGVWMGVWGVDGYVGDVCVCLCVCARAWHPHPTCLPSVQPGLLQAAPQPPQAAPTAAPQRLLPCSLPPPLAQPSPGGRAPELPDWVVSTRVLSGPRVITFPFISWGCRCPFSGRPFILGWASYWGHGDPGCCSPCQVCSILAPDKSLNSGTFQSEGRKCPL